MNKEIEEIIEELKQHTWLEYEQMDKLLSYIEQLEKRNKEIYEGFIATQEELTDYATKIDKAIEYFKFENPEIFNNPKYVNHLWTIDGLTIKKFIDILKGDSNE